MRNIEEYKPTSRELVNCLTSEYQWLELLKNNGKVYQPVLDYLIDIGKQYDQNTDNYDYKKNQLKAISENTGISTPKIKKNLIEIYNDIFELNYSNPELFNNGGTYLYELRFSYFSYYGYFNLWLPVMFNQFDRFNFYFISAKVETSSFWVVDIFHRHENGKTNVSVNLKGGFPNKYRELLLAKAEFMNEISFREKYELYDYQLDKKLIEYARREKL